MSHTWMSHAIYTNKPYHTHECAMPHIRMRQVTYARVLSYTNEWVTPHTWTSHATHMNGSYHRAYLLLHQLLQQTAIAHVVYRCCNGVAVVLRYGQRTWHALALLQSSAISNVTHMNTSGHVRMSHVLHEWCPIWMSHVTHMNESCHTYESVIPHTWRSHTTNLTYDLSLTHTWRVSHTQMTCLFHTQHAPALSSTASHVTHMNTSCHTYEYVMSHIWIRHVTHMSRACHIHWAKYAACFQRR